MSNRYNKYKTFKSLFIKGGQVICGDKHVFKNSFETFLPNLKAIDLVLILLCLV